MNTSKAEFSEARFPSFQAMRAWQAGLDRRSSEGLLAIHAFVERRIATGAILGDESERWAAQSLLDYWAAILGREGRPCSDPKLSQFDPKLAPVLSEEARPYLGLHAFEERDHARFFGRDQEIEQIYLILRDQALLAIVGPSGSGKSSLARAGLAVALQRHAEGATRWSLLPPVLPGADPNAALDRALGSAPLQRERILLIDQFEELFTLCSNASARKTFMDRLLAFLDTPGDNRVVLTLRSDFEEYVAGHPRLYERYRAGRLQLLPLRAAELREAIEAPAEAVGLKFERGVVDSLMHDLLGEPAGLPLLQTSLNLLWRNRERNLVTMAAYQRIGGGRRARVAGCEKPPKSGAGKWLRACAEIWRSVSAAPEPRAPTAMAWFSCSAAQPVC